MADTRLGQRCFVFDIFGGGVAIIVVVALNVYTLKTTVLFLGSVV